MKKNIIAVGNTARKICEHLKDYAIYEVYEISNDSNAPSENSFKIEERADAEVYESNFNPEDVPFLAGIEKHAQIFVCGASQTSGIILKLMQALVRRGVAVEVIYFTPETAFLSRSQTLQERTCRSVLQEYARSGAIEDITLISNKNIENIIGSPSIYDYYSNINKAFSESFYMLDVFKSSEPVLSTFSRKTNTSKIKTIGISNLLCEDNLFFPLKNQDEVYYYFGVNEDSLKNDQAFFSSLREKLKTKLSNSKKVYFGIYSTKYDHDYVYVETYSSKIQELIVDTE